jgi:formate hydrogenlyase subunit 6/NADH:ubiquinone oxidoreductase subunit I
MKGANNTYFGNIKEGIRSSLKGLSLSWKHLKEARQSRKPIFVDNPDYFKQQTGIVTLQYPHEQLPLPDVGRYQLHNEMDDCIVCDKCAKICPVDCIEIEPIKATGIAGYASDGSAIRLYAAKFDIDMAKCCFCGLCTTVCPTECLTMTKEYDFSTFDITTHNFEFGNLTPEQAQEKRELYDQFMLEKEAMKKVVSHEPAAMNSEEEAPKPAFRPSFKKTETESPVVGEAKAEETPKPKPVFRPSFKKTETESPVVEEAKAEETPKPKPAFKPAFKKTEIESPVVEEVKPEETPKPKLAFRPSFKKTEIESPVVEEVKTEEAPKPKPVFRPSFKKTETESPVVEEVKTEEVPKPKPVFKPTFKKVENPVVEEKIEEPKTEETPKPKPVFKPKFKKPDNQ